MVPGAVRMGVAVLGCWVGAGNRCILSLGMSVASLLLVQVGYARHLLG